jgi:peptidoglycan hydrolase-like protein with peptidoglycan-binding domain
MQIKILKTQLKDNHLLDEITSSFNNIDNKYKLPNGTTLKQAADITEDIYKYEQSSFNAGNIYKDKVGKINFTNLGKFKVGVGSIVSAFIVLQIAKAANKK